MKKENTIKKESLQKRLDHYSSSAKSMKKQLESVAPQVLSVGAAFLASMPVAEATIIHSGTQNINVAWAAGNNNDDEFIDIDGGGNDLRFFGLNSNNQPVLQLTLQGNANAAEGSTVGGFAYPLANSANAPISAGQTWQATNQQTMANSRYNGGNWRTLPNGTTRFLGIRLSLGCGNGYGWVQVTKNNVRDYTIVDWAYDDACGSINAGVLPVELLSFTTKVIEQNMVSLKWSTASEINNAGFEIERSLDGENFKNLTFIEGKGTTFEQQDYLFDDKNLRQGQLYYYRLKQIDFDGNFEYSKVITAELEDNEISGTFSPNPSGDGSTRLSYNAGEEGQLKLRVFDVTGKELLTQTHNVAEGENQLDLNFSELSNGTFFVKMEQGARSFYQKLIMNFK